ncbi:tail collar domain [Pantoea allii]|uniref:Tail collar domain n=3 Tax=Pantoea allii TaxID=574096 RepID=A0A2V2BD27_9GAMM|nr:phage tail protein [Pantoea allii]NQS87134.1 phage tail protein [Pantoea allii]PWK98434.1 tail collar domain [Pantoea allii]
MTTKYFALLTNQGAAKLANAAALGTQLQITQMAVGDGGGTLPTPDPAQTKLVGEKRRAALNSLKVDAANSSQIIAEQIIPEGEGGFWIREIGLYDADGVMVAVANCAETYKPQLQEGSGRTQTVRMILIVNSTSAVTLKIDPSVVLATRQYVDDNVIEVKAYTDDVMKKHVDAANPHSQYLQTAKALAEIKDAGLVAEVLKNLGLGEGSALPVGVPVPWPSANPPTGWLKCNGAAITSAQYPLLARAYPSLKLPDLRGEFIRGWDDGRGIDSNRELLAAQISTYLRTGMMDYNGSDVDSSGVYIGMAYSGADSVTKSVESPNGIYRAPNNSDLTFSVSQDNGVSGSASNVVFSKEGSVWISMRPRNIAFNYIVRAA